MSHKSRDTVFVSGTAQSRVSVSSITTATPPAVGRSVLPVKLTPESFFRWAAQPSPVWTCASPWMTSSLPPATPSCRRTVSSPTPSSPGNGGLLGRRSLHSCLSTDSVVDMHACQKILGILGEQIGADYWVVCSLLGSLLTTPRCTPRPATPAPCTPPLTASVTHSWDLNTLR